MNTNRKVILIILIIIIACFIMALVDGFFKPEYYIKSFIKIFLFLLFPISYIFLDKTIHYKNLFIPNRQGLLFAFSSGIAVYIVILLSYFIVNRYISFSNIIPSLESNVGVDKSNFIFVSLYISFVNSLLEEFFFRGFTFLTLKEFTSLRFAHLFSAFVFSIYHIAMMIGWFSLPTYLLIMLGLFIGAIIFNYFADKYQNIYVSFIVHMFANFGINTVGFILFGII